jgi:peptidyl-prolyl isomerase H (cyclophilin H)
MDLEIEGRDIGRLDFELFGNAAPKTVNNFLGFVSGDFNPYQKYKGSYFLNVVEQRFITGGDFVNNDGTGSTTVYPEQVKIKSEKNNLKFSEPYLLAMSADSEGNTGCQFFITL